MWIGWIELDLRLYHHSVGDALGIETADLLPLLAG